MCCESGSRVFSGSDPLHCSDVEGVGFSQNLQIVIVCCKKTPERCSWSCMTPARIKPKPSCYDGVTSHPVAHGCSSTFRNYSTCQARIRTGQQDRAQLHSSRISLQSVSHNTGVGNKLKTLFFLMKTENEPVSSCDVLWKLHPLLPSHTVHEIKAAGRIYSQIVHTGMYTHKNLPVLLVLLSGSKFIHMLV